jgi:V/A-type H+-transporting ATPase subunit I
MVKTSKKKVPPVFKLMLLLGASNFIWGVLTCSWFGVEAEKLPKLLQNISLPLISNVTASQSSVGDAIVRQNMMIICFTLALVQLSIGHIIAITCTKGLKILGELGSMAMIIGMYGIVLALIASNKARDLKEYIPVIYCAYVLGGGFIINFIFVNYEGNIAKSIVESLKNFISMVLNIANVFSDIMSYIRLWAVGLAGAAISSTVVGLAGPMLGHFILFIFGVALLAFGHSLNLVLNALSVLVHGVRLNTLEFSGHVGLTWAGTAYRPFATRK